MIFLILRTCVAVKPKRLVVYVLNMVYKRWKKGTALYDLKNLAFMQETSTKNFDQEQCDIKVYLANYLTFCARFYW